MKADGILFRCSRLGDLMTEPKSKSELLSETCKKYLVEAYVIEQYNRFKEISAKTLDKGNDVEEDGITIVSRITKQFFTKNTVTHKNAFIKGTHDLHIGDDPYKSEQIKDVKCPWDIHTFHDAKYSSLNKKYYWQGQGYMALTGAKHYSLDYCLINTPYYLVESELRKESYSHLNGDTPAWIELQIIANHVYDQEAFDKYIEKRGCYATDDNSRAVRKGFVEVPLSERHHSFKFDRNDDDIKRLYDRITECRKYMNETFFKQESLAA